MKVTTEKDYTVFNSDETGKPIESKLKTAAMDSVGELPAGYLHLPTRPIKQEPELTDWFDGGKFNPFYAGVYETGYSKKLRSKGFQLWDGEIWGQTSESVEYAIDRPHIKGVDQVPFWRGLAKNPKVQP